MEARFSVFASLPTRRPLGGANTDPGTEPVSRFWLRWVKCHSSEKAEREEDEDSKTLRMLAVTAGIKWAVPCQPHLPCWLSDAWQRPVVAASRRQYASNKVPVGSESSVTPSWCPHFCNFFPGNTRLMQQLTRWEYKQRLSFSFELRLLSNKFGLYSSTECNTVNAVKERLFGEDQLQAKKLFDNQAGW